MPPIPPQGTGGNVGEVPGFWDVTANKLTDTVRTATIVTAADPELQLVLEAGTYQIEARIIVTSDTTPDFSHALTSAALSGTNSWGPESSDFKNLDITADQTIIVPSTVIGLVVWKGFAVMSMSGTLTYDWAQAVSDAANTTVHAGSTFAARKVL